MSNSAGEDRLSTPTEEPSIEEEDKGNEEQEHLNTNPKNDTERPTVKIVPPTSKSSKTSNTSKAVIMTRSNSPDHNDALADDSKMPRRFTQISEENQILKRQLKKQEERIKILATKLIRVISDRSNKSKREEILLEEQKARISDLENEVSNLRDKLHLSKQQLSAYTRLIPNHHHPPPSRQASMLSSSTATTSPSKLNKKPRSARSNSGGTSQPPRPSSTAASSSSRGNLLIDKHFTDKVEELLLEAKAENQALEDQLKHCRQRLTSTEEELKQLKETVKKRDADHQEKLMSVKTQLGKEQDLVKKKKQLSDNIQLIRLQRESRRTASWLSTLEAQCRALEASLQSSQDNVQQLESQLLECQEELGNEQQKSISFQKQMEDATSALSRLKELEAQIASLQEENTILKETNESLLKKAFNVTEKVERVESQEHQLKTQMSHLETVLKSEIKSKSDLQHTLQIEKEKYMRLELTNQKLQETLERLNEDMEKFKIPKSSEPEDSAPTEAKKSDTNVPQNSGEDSISSVCKGNNCPYQLEAKTLEKELASLKEQNEFLKEENNRTKIILRSQVAANKEYQREVEDLTMRLDKADQLHHRKLQDFMKVLEERTKQITHLEKCIGEWKTRPSGNNETTSSTCSQCGSSTVIRPTSSTEKGGNANGRSEANTGNGEKESIKEEEQVPTETEKMEKRDNSVDVNANVNTQGEGNQL